LGLARVGNRHHRPSNASIGARRRRGDSSPIGHGHARKEEGCRDNSAHTATIRRTERAAMGVT
jgi:hypothetical protein